MFFMRLYCRKCNIPVTEKLEELIDGNLLNEKDGEPCLPKGSYAISDGEYYTDSKSKVLINCAGLINCMNHPDRNR